MKRIRIPLERTASERWEEVWGDPDLGDWVLQEDRKSGLVHLCAYVPDEAAGRDMLRRLEASFPLPPGPILWNELPDEDWMLAYRFHFHPWACGRLHWVPEWEWTDYSLPEGAVGLRLDPGMAFGTGSHETTRLCARRLLLAADGWGEALPTRAVVDAGCGSGILALSAALLGFGEVHGFDNDPEAIRVSRENADLNGLEGRVQWAEAALPGGLRPAHLLLANIQADVLQIHARDLLRSILPGGTLVLSGILLSERDQVLEKFRAEASSVQDCGRWVWDSAVEGDWADLQGSLP